MDDKELGLILFSAISHHNESLLEDLLSNDNGIKFLDVPGENGNTLLHCAVIENDLNCVECLLRLGADPNVFDSNRARTPLHLAVELNHVDIVDIFLNYQHVNLSLRDDRNLTCYEIAQFCDNQHMVDLIHKRLETIQQLKNNFYALMNQACTSANVGKVNELLKQYEKQIVESLPQSWRSRRDTQQYARLALKELLNWSSSNWNDVSLLFKSASLGHTKVCKTLIDYGAAARCNENTNYSPLYVAAYGGFTDTVKLLLDNFPSLIQEVTIEKWTILHACCLQGHSDTAKLVLNYPYPDTLKSRYVSRSNQYEYQFAFDLNAQDAAGQTVVYLAVAANNEQLLDTLLQFSLKAKLLGDHRRANVTLGSGSELNPSSRNINERVKIVASRPKSIYSEQNQNLFPKLSPNSQLSKIVRQLCRLETEDTSSKNGRDDDGVDCTDNYLVCPFEMDTYCDYNSKTALHLAVCQQYHNIATTLLINGSNPNLPILSRDSMKDDFGGVSDIGLNWLRSSKSTCLKEACRLNDETMCEILIRYGASDNQDNLALQVASSNRNNRLISMFLSLKSNVDPEYKINKKCNVEFASRFKQGQRPSKPSFFGGVTTTFSSMFPATPVTVDWQNLKCIRHIEPQWLIDASLIHNKRLRHPTNGLMAITRLDLSSNKLKSIHPVIFRLPSLRELNLSGNRLETLIDIEQQRNSYERNDIASTSKLIASHRTAMKRSKSSNLSPIGLEASNIIDLNEPQEWDLPHLEVLDLHDNLLISLPDCLFSLPKLTELDVSFNQLRQLPFSIWTAPSLRELIASGNLLDDLPRAPSLHNPSIDSDIPPICESPSSASNHSLEHVEKSFVSSVDSADSSLTSFQLDSLSVVELTDIQMKLSNQPVDHINNWQSKVELVESPRTVSIEESLNSDDSRICMISHINLSHNSFTKIPPALACLATELYRLNLSHNRIKTLGSISLYPTKVKNLDLSHNHLSCWFQTDSIDDDSKHCYANSLRSSFGQKLSGSIHCSHKVHSRLDNLKSLNLSNNFLPDVQLFQSKSDSTKNKMLSQKECLLYPSLTALDVSFNSIKQVPVNFYELKDLSVLNLSGNTSISTLPAELGLASKLWNLGVNGCNLSEPLKSIVESKTYKTLDILGYLKSILEESKPYARMKLMLVGLQGIGKTSLLERMRHEGSAGMRRRAPEHWTRRMGHSNRGNMRNQKGVTLSTVGIDIHDWVYVKKTARNQHNFGQVSFSTWDFGGQEEFYATHRYFLSKRSVYLVVWRLTDGLEGIAGIQQWLVNIQSRAASSPVIIVGTHEDMIDGGEKSETVQRLQSEVAARFVNVSDHDKCGLPRVVDSIVVSIKTNHNIKYLCNRIYDTVFSLRSPGGTERLLQQKIPATYLYLEEIVNLVVHDRQQKKREPVLTYDEYRRTMAEQLKMRHNKTFRDLEPLDSHEINYNSELQQATRFLHENGVLLHYEDANLRDLYFLDPQWLCDILSHVVTIREINPHVKNGLMKISDLDFLFKSVDINLHEGVQSYVVNLLNKFEVALTWNSQYLLIPSLLPNDSHLIDRQHDFQVKLAPRMRGRSVVRRHEPNRAANRPLSVDPSGDEVRQKHTKFNYEIEPQPRRRTTRIVLLRYLPAGFLARLQSSILSDSAFDDICADIHLRFGQSFEQSSEFKQILGSRPSWTCWKRGIRLTLEKESTINSSRKSEELAPGLMSIQEFETSKENSNLSQFSFKIESLHIVDGASSNVDMLESAAENQWCDFDISQYSNLIMVVVPTFRLKVTSKDDPSNQFYIELDSQEVARIIARAVDHIDNLLEDWYPSLGTRFAHTLGGNYLVTRILPCTACSDSLSQFQNGGLTSSSHRSRQSRFDSDSAAASHRERSGRARVSVRSAKDPTFRPQVPELKWNHHSAPNVIYCYYVEHCILSAYNLAPPASGKPISARDGTTNPKIKRMRCPKHGTLTLNELAPDIVFDDIPASYMIDSEQIDRHKLIGRGALGFVFKGSLNCVSYPLNQLGQANQEVALKLLQPVDPGPEADQSDLSAYNSARSNWNREPFQCACKSYCTARHEINILEALSHPNIVGFLGLCMKPLAIVLELAPLGSMSDIVGHYKRAGARIDVSSVQQTIFQVARALEFLHQHRVIYRDLKTENILTWSFPAPLSASSSTQTNAQSNTQRVEVKLADYGISRQALSTGVWKGFAGTINFLAPEILRHNGDEEYTEKVDCFSFGVFIYELLTLKSPFKQMENARNHLSDGGWPALARRDLIYPTHVFDLVSLCLSQEPHLRPTASQIVSIVSSPEFTHILDVSPIDCSKCSDLKNFSSLATIMPQDELVLSLVPSDKLEMKLLTADANQFHECVSLESSDRRALLSTSICTVDGKLWLYDLVSKQMYVIALDLGVRHKSGALDSSLFDDSHDHPQSKPVDNDATGTVSTFRLEIDKSIRPQVLVRSMLYVKNFNCLLFLLSDGSLWIYYLSKMKSQKVEDGSISFNCIALPDCDGQRSTVVKDDASECFNIYCGQTNGISSLEITNGELTRQSIMPLAFRSNDSNGEQIIEPGQSAEVTSILATQAFAWTAAGCSVHLWSLKDKSVIRKLDCWKLVPCSESLESINIEQYYQEAKSSHVSSLVRILDKLYIGTSHGCFMVIEANSMKPITVFRPFDCGTIILNPEWPGKSTANANQRLQTEIELGKRMVIIGKGYRNLVKRYVSSVVDSDRCSRGAAILLEANHYDI